MTVRTLCMLGLWMLTPSLLQAQSAAVSPGAMAQGEAAVNVQSDVKLGVKGTGGTTRERLAKLGAAVGDQMGQIRGCYRKLIAKTPDVVGSLRVTLSLQQGAKPKVESSVQEGASAALADCVSSVLRKPTYAEVGRPAAAVLTLEFDNTRARGQTAMNERVSEKSRVEVKAADSGHQEAVWSTEGNELTFTVHAEPSTPKDAVSLVMRALRAGYAAFLDCRRHSEKGGLSPEGDIEASVQVDRDGKARVKVGKITVAHPRAPQCAERSWKHVEFEKPASTLRVDVTVHFAK